MNGKDTPPQVVSRPEAQAARPEHERAGLHWVVARASCQNLLLQLCRGFDRGDRALIRSVFADDADIDYGTFRGGPDAFAEWAMSTLDGWSGTTHALSNVLARVSGDRAVTESYVSAMQYGDAADRQSMMVGARYLNAFADTPEGWRITAHKVVVDARVLMPAAMKPPRGVATGLRGDDDPSYGHFETLPGTAPS